MRVMNVLIPFLLVGTTGLGLAKKTPTLEKTSFAGTVQAVDVRTHNLKVADNAGHVLQMTANNTTEILKDQRPVSLADLKPNDPVVVRYWTDSTHP